MTGLIIGMLSACWELHERPAVSHGSATFLPIKLVNTLSHYAICVGSYTGEHRMYIPRGLEIKYP